jgi:hypothetical protein
MLSKTNPFHDRKDLGGGKGNVQSTNREEDDAKLPAGSDTVVAAVEALQDNHLDSPLPVRFTSPCHCSSAADQLCLLKPKKKYVGVPFASRQSVSGEDSPKEDIAQPIEYFHDTSAPDGTLDLPQSSPTPDGPFVFADEPIEQAASQFQVRAIQLSKANPIGSSQ